MKNQTAITVKHTFKDQDISDLLGGAFEGGSSYWCAIEGQNVPKNKQRDRSGVELSHYSQDIPMMGGSVDIQDTTDGKRHSITKKMLLEGLSTMAQEQPQHFSDFVTEDYDANTSDVFLQLCLFGQVIYG